MFKHAEQTSSASQPALVLLYGTAGASLTRQPLDRDAVILGKGRGCDLVLTAPDVSNIHCVITRGAGTYSIRDCGSRAGTRLNGEPIQEASLHDGDLVQVGPFSFRVQLPPPRKPAAAQLAEARQLRLERQRRNLARLALAQRRRLQALEKVLSGGLGARALLDFATKASGLRQKLRDYQQRLTALEQGERDLSRDRDLLAREQSAFRERVQIVEADLARRAAELDAALRHRLEAEESIL
jgi:pSer/pThr/pTyr-binding forkhead associated (FHA) protein